MSLVIRKLNDETIDLNDIGLKVLEFEPESLEVINDVVGIDGGYVINRTTYGPRYIHATFKFMSDTITNYAQKRAEIFNLFTITEPFYLTDKRTPDVNWYVKNDGKFNLQRNLKSGEFSVSFICVNKYALATMTTTVNYNVSAFTVDYDGTALLDPRENYLELTVKATSAENLQIKNETTGDTYIYKEPLNSDDELSINGIRTFKNGIDKTLATNFGLITLTPGENNIIVSNGVLRSIRIRYFDLYK